MDSQFKLPRHVRQPISNSAPHTSQFQELLMEAAPNRGEEGYARSWLEKNGVLRKRKRADDDEALSNDHKRASSMSTSDFRKPLHSTTPTKALSTPEFKRPQPLQRERLYALQSRLANEEQASKGTPSKKSRIESQPASPKTPTTNLARPSPSSSTTLASGKPLSALSSNLSRASHQIPAMQRAEHTPTPISRTPKYKPRDSSLSVTGARDRSTSGKSQVSEPQRSIFKLPNQSSTVEGSRRGRTSNSTREQVNSNRSRFTNNANFHVPTIDRQKQHPPPEPTELNRILAQVPDILKELDEKQAQVIRDLAKKVNHQEDDIRDLKSNIVELNDHVTTSNNLIVELKNKVEQVERRVGQENQALREDNELLRKRVEKHIDVTCENIVEQVEHRLKQLEEKMTMEDDYEPSEGLIDVQDPAKAKEEDTNIFLQQE